MLRLILINNKTEEFKEMDQNKPKKKMIGEKTMTTSMLDYDLKSINLHMNE